MNIYLANQELEQFYCEHIDIEEAMHGAQDFTEWNDEPLYTLKDLELMVV